MRKIYIAGPMSGYPKYNFPAFFAAADLWRSRGYDVSNPADKSNEAAVVEHSSFGEGDSDKLLESGWSFIDAFSWDTDHVIHANAIYMLKGWEHSPGARGEHAVAVAMQSKDKSFEIFYE